MLHHQLRVPPSLTSRVVDLPCVDQTEIPSALVQLGTDLAGMILAGTATLLVQRVLWARIDGSSRHSQVPGMPG